MFNSTFLALWIVALGAAGCGATEAIVVAPIALRAETAGSELLRFAPAGADILLEVDLRRLRANTVVGPLVDALSPIAVSPAAVLRGGLLAGASAVLVSVYGVGDGAEQLILLRARKGVELAAVAIGGGVYAVGEPIWVAKAVALGGASGGGQSMAQDSEMLRLRDEVMPGKAESASVRAVARLGFEARVAVASRVGMSEVPVSLSLWADVADDLALVVRVNGEQEASQERLQQAMVSLRERVASKDFMKFLGLDAPLRTARVSRSLSYVQVVLVLSPRRLALLARRLLHQLHSAAGPPVPISSSASIPQSLNSSRFLHHDS